MITLYLDKIKSSNDFIMEVINKHTSIEIELDDIKRQSGRPVIKNIKKKISLSHTKNEIACVVSDNRIGLDIEKIKFIEFKKIIKRLNLFSLEFNLNENSSLIDFYIFWTSLESFSKFNGKGLKIIFSKSKKINKSKIFTLIIDDLVISLYSNEIDSNTIICLDDKRLINY